ncbi:TetR/AcrR family transcriptional regulator [Frankia sp. CNm7]|uniref:TetR/AcrR family transcriptional regulator n=1 Tax=Frankia nepalensis TaxID=1836974 RepID=A0A937UP79_9ACTN|nr:TetR/AcrR family transcriptional regulator [Frankia nepalensis]MBL7495481.1 TetR/AcrR family transcriptional regulator [Frankia nepalensis]MBL7510849.1 TetR/AcrR family transcriptional regulator [Frankia nepalensis]MBL7522324.1 TetR/AcrR family transcriptional regulator [Frankia nepalensis]MBL7630584.1 TetR/AcrR family transcriptional regulator [Frankia nepalensis]
MTRARRYARTADVRPGDARSADTRAALLAAARRRFADQGYAATGTEEIVADAKVTRGALYHHFRDKADLFREVMKDVASEVAAALVANELTRDDPEGRDAWTQLRTGFQSLLDISTRTDTDFQRIVLVDGPSVLGSDVWDELVEKHGYRLLAQWLERAMTEEKIDRIPLVPLTRLVVALLAEASIYVARSADPLAARQETGIALDRLLSGLVRAPRPAVPQPL